MDNDSFKEGVEGYLSCLKEVNESLGYENEDYVQVGETIKRMVGTLPEGKKNYMEILSGNAPASIGLLYLQKKGFIEPKFGKLSCVSVDMGGQEDLSEKLIEAYQERLGVEVGFYANVVDEDGFWFLEDEDELDGVLIVNALNEFIPKDMVKHKSDFPMSVLYNTEGKDFPAGFNLYHFLQEENEEVFIYQNPDSYFTKPDLSEVKMDISSLIQQMREFYAAKSNIHVHEV